MIKPLYKNKKEAFMKRIISLILILSLLLTIPVFAEDSILSWIAIGSSVSASSNASEANRNAAKANEKLKNLEGMINSNINNKPSHFIKFTNDNQNDQYVDMANIISINGREDKWNNKYGFVLKDCFGNYYYSQLYKSKEEVNKIQENIIDEYNQVLKEYYKNKEKE